VKEFDRFKVNRWCGKWVYIDYLCESKSGRTNIYQVIAEGIHLGDIKWYAPWRKYAFFSNPDTLYEQDCLRDIAKFIEGKMKEYKRRGK